MYLKPLSTASVTTTDPCGSLSASRRAPTTFAPLEVPAKMPSSCARRTVIASASPSSIAQTSSMFAGSQSGGTIPDQPCIANEPPASPVIAADPAGSRPTTSTSAFRSLSAAATPSSARRADPLDEGRELAIGLLPDLTPERRPVAGDGVRVVELVGRVRAGLAGELGGALD